MDSIYSLFYYPKNGLLVIEDFEDPDDDGLVIREGKYYLFDKEDEVTLPDGFVLTEDKFLEWERLIKQESES